MEMTTLKIPMKWAQTASIHGEYWVKCPHCETTHNAQTTAFKPVKTESGDYVRYHGTPVISCPKCGGYIY